MSASCKPEYYFNAVKFITKKLLQKILNKPGVDVPPKSNKFYIEPGSIMLVTCKNACTATVKLSSMFNFDF